MEDAHDSPIAVAASSKAGPASATCVDRSGCESPPTTEGSSDSSDLPSLLVTMRSTFPACSRTVAAAEWTVGFSATRAAALFSSS